MEAERRRTASVRFRITATATVAVLVVLTVSSVVLVLIQRRQLTANLDEALELRIDDLRPLIVDGRVGDTLPLGDDDGFAQLVAGGRVVAATPNLAGADPLDPPVRLDGRGYRTKAAEIATDGGTARLLVGISNEDVHETTLVVSLALAVIVPVVTALLAALVWVLVGRTLAPVEAIRVRVAGMTGRDLHERVPVPPTGDEVARLAGTMNEMLDRVEHAAERQRRFVDDSSHELRSPLTRIRTALEVDLADPAADLRATLGGVLDDTTELQDLVADLLLLARLDDRHGRPRAEPVDLDDVVLAEIARLRERGGVRVDASGVSAGPVHGVATELGRVVRNLLDNAARHAESVVTVALGERDDDVILRVADDGSGVPTADRERIFERFTRLDDARGRDAGGTGLGLAIVRELVEAHGGTVTLDGPSTFAVTLPRRRA